MTLKTFLKKNKPLVILEMANNHMGDVSHGIKIIDKYFNLTKKFNQNIDFAIKFQFRDIKTYIHEDFLSNTEDKYVSRFLETQFSHQFP